MIIDAFPFFQEIELLKVRLNYLGPTVDKFLISESEIDFAANPKKKILTPEIVGELPFNNKIVVIQNKFSSLQKSVLFPFAKKIKWRKPLWGIQLKQRNSIIPTLQQFKSDDILLFGDLDEFPNNGKLENIKELLSKNPEKIYSFNHKTLVYNLLTRDGNENWSGTIACSVKKAITSSPNKLRKQRFSSNFEGDGWHFSYFGDSKQIQRKIRSVAAVEKQYDLLDPSIEQVINQIRSKRNPFERNYYKKREIRIEEYPKELISSFQKFMPCSLTDE